MALFAPTKRTSQDITKTENSTSTTKASGTNAFDRTTTALAPDWIEDFTRQTLGGIGSLGGANPSNYVAGSNAWLDRAGAGAGDLSGLPWNFDAALGETAQVMNSDAVTMKNAARASDYVSNYLDPYLKDVVDSTAADWDAKAGDVRAQQALDLARSGAFGGSRAALTMSETEGELARGRASTISGLRSKGYETALNAAQQDAAREQERRLTNVRQYTDQMDRALGAAQQLGSLSTAQQDQQRQNIDLQSKIGDLFRGIDAEQRAAPLDLMDWQTGQAGKLDLGRFFGEHAEGTGESESTSTTEMESLMKQLGITKETTDPSTMDKVGKVAKVAGTVAKLFAMSDIRLKRDIRRIGTHPELGVGIYTYEYVWGGPRQVGVMAQELLGVKPQAVAAHASGYLMVDYGAL